MAEYSFQIILALVGVINAMGYLIFSGLSRKLDTICASNKEDHTELFTARREMEKDIEGIQQLHHIRGCDLPMKGKS